MKKIQFLGKFLVKQLYRFQYGYQKLAGLLGISNAVSLLLIMINSFGIIIPTYVIIIVYFAIFVFSILFVFILERLGSLHSESKLQFQMKNSELYRNQTNYLSLLIARNMKKPLDDIDRELESFEQKLFQNKK